MLIDEILPHFDFREFHSIDIHSSPDLAYRTLHQITPAELPLLRVLMALRSLPSRLNKQKRRNGFASDTPLLKQVLGGSFFVLGESENQELVLGTIGQFWKPTGGQFISFVSVKDFESFAELGFAKSAVNFRVEQLGKGLCRVSTETRVSCTDERSRKVFSAYWVFIRPWSGLIRREFLAALQARCRRT